MKSRAQIWLALACLAGAPGVRAAPGEQTDHIDNTLRLLPPKLDAINVLEAQLADFERTTGIRILLEFHARPPSPEEDKVPGAYMRMLSARRGTLQHGVLIVYVAADRDWRVWIGDDLASRFAGKPGTAKELTKSGAMHEAKEAMLESARAKAESSLAELQKTLPAFELPSPEQEFLVQTAALLEAVMKKLGPAPRQT